MNKTLWKQIKTFLFKPQALMPILYLFLSFLIIIIILHVDNLQRFSEAYTFIALLKGSYLWSINDLMVHCIQIKQAMIKGIFASPHQNQLTKMTRKIKEIFATRWIKFWLYRARLFSKGKNLVNCFDFVQKITGGFLLILFFHHLNHSDLIHWIMKA